MQELISAFAARIAVRQGGRGPLFGPPAAGIGENTSFIREKILAYLGYLGITMDAEANKVRGEEKIISTPDSRVKVCVIPTNEELAICRETVALVG